MKKINLEFKDVFNFIRKNNISSFNRMALCYPIKDFENGIEKNPFTIFDHQKNYGKKLGFQKEGIQLNFDGNIKKLDFFTEEIYIPN